MRLERFDQYQKRRRREKMRRRFYVLVSVLGTAMLVGWLLARPSVGYCSPGFFCLGTPCARSADCAGPRCVCAKPSGGEVGRCVELAGHE